MLIRKITLRVIWLYSLIRLLRRVSQWRRSCLSVSLRGTKQSKFEQFIEIASSFLLAKTCTFRLVPSLRGTKQSEFEQFIKIASSFLLAKTCTFILVPSSRHEAIWVWTIHWDCFVVPPCNQEKLHKEHRYRKGQRSSLIVLSFNIALVSLDG